MSKIPEWVWKTLSVLIIPAMIWATTLQIRFEKMETRLEVLDLEKMQDTIEDDHVTLQLLKKDYEHMNKNLESLVRALENSERR